MGSAEPLANAVGADPARIPRRRSARRRKLRSDRLDDGERPTPNRGVTLPQLTRAWAVTSPARRCAWRARSSGSIPSRWEQSADAEPDAGSIRTPFAQPDAAADAPAANDVDKTLN